MITNEKSWETIAGAEKKRGEEELAKEMQKRMEREEPIGELNKIIVLYDKSHGALVIDVDGEEAQYYLKEDGDDLIDWRIGLDVLDDELRFMDDVEAEELKGLYRIEFQRIKFPDFYDEDSVRVSCEKIASWSFS